MKKKMFSGSIVALITPFKGGYLHEEALQSLVEWHCQEGTQGIVVGGSTGEALSLSVEERERSLTLAVEAVAGRLPIIAGCGVANTQETLSLMKMARKAGASAALVISPYFIKPTPEGLYHHFSHLQSSDLPTIIYNNPARTGIDISVDMVVRLASLTNIIGIKDSSCDLSRPVELRQRIHKPFTLLSGDDLSCSAYLAQGGDGCISVTANVIPNLFYNFIKAWQEQDLNTFGRYRDQLLPLHKALGGEPNPIPVKYAVSLLQRCQNELRLPLVPASSATQYQVLQALQNVKTPEEGIPVLRKVTA